MKLSVSQNYTFFFQNYSHKKINSTSISISMFYNIQVKDLFMDIYIIQISIINKKF